MGSLKETDSPTPELADGDTKGDAKGDAKSDTKGDTNGDSKHDIGTGTHVWYM